MTDSTPHFALPLLLASQADKHVTLNEALLKLDQLLHLTVLSSTIATQPAAPIPNARYILPTNATGPVWSSLPRQSVAVWDGEAWSCLTPKLGWIAYIEDLAELHIFRNGNWLETVATLDGLASTPRVWTPGFLQVLFQFVWQDQLGAVVCPASDAAFQRLRATMVCAIRFISVQRTMMY